MPRRPRPWWKASHEAYYCKISGRLHRLGENEADAIAAFRRLRPDIPIDSCRPRRPGSTIDDLEENHLPSTTTGLLAHEDVRNTLHGRHQYDLAGVIREALLPGRARFGPPSGLAGEVDADLRSRLGGLSVPEGAVLLPPSGIWSTERRALTTTTGAGSIATTVVGDFIPALRSRLILGSLGARIMDFNPGASGKVKLTRVTTGSDAHWVSTEGDSPAEAEPETESVVFVPHSLVGRVRVTRTLLSSAPGVAGKVTGDLLSAIAVAIDAAGVNGSGSDGEPVGLLNTAGLPTVALGPNGAALARASLVAIEKTAANANGDAGADAMPGWLTNPDVRAKLRLTENATGSGRYLLEDGRILDNPVGVTTNVPNGLSKGSGEDLSAIVYGDWSRIAINIFGGIPWILVDPFKQSADGTVHIVCGVEADVQVLQVDSFCSALDVVTS